MTSEGTSTPSPKRRPVELVGKLFDGRVRLERLSTTQNISARTFIQGKLIRKSTRETTLGAAKVAARRWYETLLARHRLGENIHGPTFADIAKKFLAHANHEAVVSEGQRRNYSDKWNLLKPHFDGIKIKDIDARFLLELRRKRAASVTKLGTPITPATLKKDFIFISQVMKHAKEMEKCISELPAFPSFGGTFSISKHGRPFLDEQQYKKLHQSAKERASELGLNPRTQRQRQELYWFILLSVGAALRVGEAYSIRWCDCELVMLKRPDGTEEEVVKMEVLGKHSKQGKRELAYAMFGGVFAFKEMQKARPEATPTDLLFQENHREGIKELLTISDLRMDKKTGRTRDAKSLRPTGISLRLEKGDNVDYRDIARWCRSSPAMIAAFYDQNHPEKSVERLLTFRKSAPSEKTSRGKRSRKGRRGRQAG
jgi:integrase